MSIFKRTKKPTTDTTLPASIEVEVETLPESAGPFDDAEMPPVETVEELPLGFTERVMISDVIVSSDSTRATAPGLAVAAAAHAKTDRASALEEVDAIFATYDARMRDGVELGLAEFRKLKSEIAALKL